MGGHSGKVGICPMGESPSRLNLSGRGLLIRREVNRFLWHGVPKSIIRRVDGKTNTQSYS